MSSATVNSESSVPDPNDIRNDPVLFPLYITLGVLGALCLLALIAVLVIYCGMGNNRNKHRIRRNANGQMPPQQYTVKPVNGVNAQGHYNVGTTNPSYAFGTQPVTVSTGYM